MKPTLTIAGTYHYSTEVLESFEELKPTFRTTIKRYEEFQAGELTSLLWIIIAGLAGGFVGAIGEDAWKLLKKKILGVIVRPDGGDSELELQIEDDGSVLNFKCRSNDHKVFESALDKAYDIIKLNAKKGKRQEYVFDRIKDRWEH